MPERFVCPRSELPEDLYANKKWKKPSDNATKRDSFKSSGSSPSNPMTYKHKVYGNNDSNVTQKDLRHLYTEIKEFSSSTSSVVGKRKAMEDKLTKLGAPPAKQMKIPFNIKLGMMKKQKMRAEKQVLKVKETGVVTVKEPSKSKKNSRDQRSKRPKSDNIDTINVRNGMVKFRQHPLKK